MGVWLLQATLPWVWKVQGAHAAAAAAAAGDFCTDAAASRCSRPSCPTHPPKNKNTMPAGYIGSLSLLQTVVRVAEKLRQYNPGLVYGMEAFTAVHLRSSTSAHYMTVQLSGQRCSRAGWLALEPSRSTRRPLAPCAVCDPVMGDDGRLYVHPEMPPAFRDLVVPQVGAAAAVLLTVWRCSTGARAAVLLAVQGGG